MKQLSWTACLLFALTSTACGAVADGPTTNPPERSASLVGRWRSSDGATSTTLTLAGDGTARTADSAGNARTWKIQGSTLVFGDESIPIAIGVGCRLVELGGHVYVADGPRTGCPTTPAPLSSDESCLVGDFTRAATIFHFESDRFFREEGREDGREDAPKSATYGSWSLAPNGDVVVTDPTGKTRVRTNLGALGSMTSTMPSSCRATLFSPAGCTAIGEGCAEGATCCGGRCISFSGGAFACVASCTRNEDCATGCCAEVKDGKGSVCADSLYCAP
jgi:hypothetical protein